MTHGADQAPEAEQGLPPCGIALSDGLDGWGRSATLLPLVAFDECSREEANAMREKAVALVNQFRLDVRLRAAAEQRPQLKRELWALLHEAATEIERLHGAAFARAADADRLSRFEEWLADRAGPLLHIDAVREALE